MKKRLILLTSIGIITLALNWCWKSDQEQNSSSSSTSSQYISTFEITWWIYSQSSFNASVISENTKNIVSTRAWIITSINCEAWKKIKAKDLIARIEPDTSDVNYQNTSIQRNSINEQINNIQWVISFTKANFDAQAKQLENQKVNNEQQLKILEKNLVNLQKTQNLTSSDITLQIKNLEDQITSLIESKNFTEKNIQILTDNKAWDLHKINDNIKNTNKQLYTTISDSLEKIDSVFWITEQNKDKNDAYENYISVKNSSLKTNTENQFWAMKEKFGNFDNMNNDQISNLVWDMSNLLKTAADSINSSVPGGSLTQTTIDSYYSLFIGLANTSQWSILTTKTNLDNLLNSLKTTENSYDNQITSLRNQLNSTNSNIQTLQINLDNLKNNKGESSMISIDSNINSLASQIANLESSNRNIDQQLNSLNESKNIQLNQLNNQIVSLNQNLRTLGNSVSGESLVAWVNWIIKWKKAELNNKIAANTLICEISPDNNEWLKLQIYTPWKIELGQQFQYTKDWVLLWTWTFETELPYKDSITQNYIYETKITNPDLKEWDKITIKLTEKKNWWTIWIPIQYVSPKLDWSYVNIKNWESLEPRKIDVWGINNWFIQVYSWLNKWELIVK